MRRRSFGTSRDRRAEIAKGNEDIAYPYNMAQVAATWGDAEEALRWLRGDPLLARLRGNPQFHGFAAEIQERWERQRAHILREGL